MEHVVKNIFCLAFVLYYIHGLQQVSVLRAVEYGAEEERAGAPVVLGHEDILAEPEHEAETQLASRSSSRTNSVATPVHERASSIDSTESLQRTGSRVSVGDAFEVDGFDFKLMTSPVVSESESIDTTHWGTFGQIAANIQGGYSLQEILEYAEQNPKYKGDVTRQQMVDEYYKQKGLGAAQPVIDVLFEQMRKANVRVLTDMKSGDLVSLIEQSKNIPTQLQTSAKLPSRYGGVSDPVSGKFMTIQDAVRYVTDQMQNPSSKMYTTLQNFAPKDFAKLQTLLIE